MEAFSFHSLVKVNAWSFPGLPLQTQKLMSSFQWLDPAKFVIACRSFFRCCF
jgi:hypothetical protein